MQNAYFLAKIGADTAENERHFAENLPKIGNYPTGPEESAAWRRRPGLQPRPRGPGFYVRLELIDTFSAVSPQNCRSTVDDDLQLFPRTRRSYIKLHFNFCKLTNLKV